ncbi:hypothetical protein RB597_009536 [Gaeumannomyces tritici]
MHLPYPSRKDSNAARYAPARRGPGSGPARFVPPILRRMRLRGGVALVALVLGVLYVGSLLRAGSSGRRGGGGGGGAYAEHVPTGSPPAVIVTVLEDGGKFSKAYLQNVKDNRILYAKKHGYETFFPTVSEYDLGGSPASWVKVVAMRHALSKFPDASFVWFLDQDSLIMTGDVGVETALMEPAALDKVMIKDHPVVPPDSIIKTFAHLKPADVDLVLTQDKDGLSVGSFILRNGEWARFFLETWYDPIYRSYNFQKAEAHALEHIVQWHPTILSKLAVVPQRYINAYSSGDATAEFKPGDVAVRFNTCMKTGPAACEAEADKYNKQWRSNFKS